jgi:hypothetical protein
MLCQNKTKGSKILLMAKEARIRACPEEEATRTAMADPPLGCQGRLGHQTLTKENLAGLSVCYAQEQFFA